MEAELKRVALITGANRGIGLAVAAQLAQSGLTAIIGARDETKGIQAQNALADRGIDVHCTVLDVTDPTSIVAAIGKISDAYRRLDVLVNNAGIMIDGGTNILELPLRLLQNTINTNALGPLLVSQACVALMRENGYGRIVNVSSTLGALSEIVNPQSSYAGLHAPAYRLSKTMLNGITALLAKELRGSNILVNSVCPGWVRTDLGGPEAPITPEEAAETVTWLATLPDDGPTGGFFRESQPLAW